ncbi:MAG: hypothetical protein ACYTBP_05130 [Planctomycetota bacterium]
MKKSKKRKIKKRYWLGLIPAMMLAFLFILSLLFLYKPAGLERSDSVRERQISQYFTNELLPEIYNQAQFGEPFEIVVPQEKTEELVKLSDWPRETGELTFLMPNVAFEPEKIVISGIVVFRETEFAVRVVGRPEMVDDRLLNLMLTDIEVGAVDITLIVKAFARNIYQERVKSKKIDENDLGEKVIASMLMDKPFDPLFKVESSKVRIDKVMLTKGKLTIGLRPVNE